MTIGKGAARRRRCHPHRQPQALGQLDRQPVGLAGIDLGPQHQHRVLGAIQPPRQALELRRRRHPGVLDLARHHQLGVVTDLTVPVVMRNRHVDRPARRQRGAVDRLAQRPRHVLGAGRLIAPLDQRLGQLRRLHVGQHRLHADHRARLLAGGDHQRRMRVPGVGQRTHGVAGARRRMQVDECRSPAGQRVAVSHPRHHALMQPQHVAEILGKALEERQLVGAGVAEDGGDALATQQ